MAHFAEIDENNIVVRVLVTRNDDPHGDEGFTFLTENLGGTWIKTSYNGNIRFNFAGIGYIYDPVDDAFISPKPECGHKTLMLNDLKRWECLDCDNNINERLASIKE